VPLSGPGCQLLSVASGARQPAGGCAGRALAAGASPRSCDDGLWTCNTADTYSRLTHRLAQRQKSEEGVAALWISSQT